MKFKYKISIYFLFVIVFSNSYASIHDCMNSMKSKDWDNIIKYCPEYSSNNGDITKVLSGAYAYKYNGLEAQKYLQIYIDKFANNDKDTESVALAFMSLGNYYYFGEDGAKKDIKKGLKYITKGAGLGNDTAQEQLATAYFNGDNLPVNYPLAYMWYTISASNGNQKAIDNYFAQHMTSYTQQAPYCVALGDHLVAKAYLDGEAGLPVSDNQAKKYLIQAIELYKEAKKPSEDELKYCPPQKDLDLASAEKLLASLK
ncbi:tetratricopeptide repeat protein [Francisella sp. SYW-2]|uniref:tetratricopeptide repeat protein n=1 Tax=Francisella sp. SYW-2 TaxID=2610886 RepID=UPI00123DD6F6|nr:SEL1-like repeat protein [Francisella sp. SYW-2]